MSRFDDRLTQELKRVAAPAEPAGAFEEIDRRRGRREAVRGLQTVMLATAVFAGSVGGVLVLNRAFRGEGSTSPAIPITPAENGPIVVSFGDDGGTHLYLQDADDTTWNPRDHQLTDPIPNWSGIVHRDTNPAVSPDGRTIVFERTIDDVGGSTTSIWTISIDGGAPRQVSPDILGGEPTWSPDGARIAYHGTSMESPGIHVVDADGSGNHVLGEGNGPLVNATDPAWSPDGERIAVAVPSGSDASIIASIDVETGHSATITPALWDAGSPAWSPDGDRLTFSQGGGIAMVTLVDGNVVDLTTTHTAEEAASADLAYTDSQPAWSPDGEWIAFERSFGPSEMFVYVVRPDGTDLHRIGLGGDPAWAAAALDASPSPADPSGAPTEEPPDATDDRPERLPGVGYPVCRPLSISGNFGEGPQGRIFVFEEAPEQGCRAREGFQHIGLAPDGETVATVSDRLMTCLDSSGCWPFATPDLDENGIDEIALGVGWVPMISSVALYRVEAPTGGGDPALTEMPIRCPSGPDCVRPPVLFDWGSSGDARASASCGLLLIDTAGGGTEARGLTIRSWTSDEWAETTYLIEDGGLVLHSGPSTFPGSAGAGTFDGTDLCGDPVFPLELIAPDVAANVQRMLEEYA